MDLQLTDNKISTKMGVYIGTTKYTGGPADASTLAIPKSVGQAAGDLIYFTGASVPVRLPIGSNGQVLTLSGGVPSWQTPSGGGGGGTTVTLPSGYNASTGITLNSSTLTTVCNIGGVDLNLKAPAGGGGGTGLEEQYMATDSHENLGGSCYGDDERQPCQVNFGDDPTRRNIITLGFGDTIVPDQTDPATGPGGSRYFYLTLNANMDASVNTGLIDHYLVIKNDTVDDVTVQIKGLEIDGSQVDVDILQEVNGGEWPSIPSGEATILCYTVGIQSNGDTIGIVSWGGNFLINRLS